MKGLFKHFLLAALLIIHTSFGSVMAAQMQSSQFMMDDPNNVVAEVVSIDDTTADPCPHHSKMMESASTQINHSMHDCNGHDCSNCNCVNVLSSIPSLSMSVDVIQFERSNVVTFTASTFPDSPPSSILRPPIS